MPKYLLLYFFFICHLHTTAQSFETFSDGDFTANPTWVGTDSLFRINLQKQLQSAGKTSLTPACLALPCASADSLEWEFWVRFAFNPSTQNQTRFYLMADSLALSQSKNAVYVQFGGSTGTTDSMSLYAQLDGKTFPILKGRPSTVGSTNNEVLVKVKLFQNKFWQFFTDTSKAKQNLVNEGNAIFELPIQKYFQGLWFRYTIGNANNLYFDNFYFGPLRKDTLAPSLLNYSLKQDSAIEISFSESLLSDEIEVQLNQNQMANYLVQTNTLTVNFTPKLISKQVQTLALKRICDRQRNCSKDTSFQFMYVEPKQHELLITELLIDPTPSIGLPEAEFIELYNNSDVPIPLQQLKLADETKIYAFPNDLKHLAPGDFIVLCNPKDSLLFSPYGEVLAFALPTLSNDGKSLYLLSALQDTLHAINYNLSSYQDPLKAQGGYSLEMHHPSRICQKNLNWSASASPMGGSPAKQNSNWHLGKDTLPPMLKQLAFVGLNQVFLRFNEALDEASWHKVVCKIDGMQSPLVAAANDSFRLQALQNFIHQQPYKIECIGLKDCSLNEQILDTTLLFYEQKTPQFLEVLINEICFDEKRATFFPKADFIELHNRSKYAVNLQDMYLSVGKTKLPLPSALIYPNSFIILCKTEAASTFAQYGNAIGLSNFPNLNLNETLMLSNLQDNIIHQVSYKSDWLNQQLYLNPLAASIELMATNNPCAQQPVWHASLSKQGSTPGKINSVQTKHLDESAPYLNLNCLLADSSILLTFNENIDLSQMRFRWLAYPDSVSPSYYFQQMNKVLLKGNVPSQYPLELEMQGVKDCANNLMAPQVLKIAPSLNASKGSLFVTEVLFDTYPNQTDFIELYNSETWPISLDNLLLIRKDLTEAAWKETVALNGPGHCIAPKSAMALHANPEQLSKTYTSHYLPSILAHPMLSLPDVGGLIELRDSQNNCIDSLYFSNDMHFEWLVQTEGISLERLQLFPIEEGPSNWFSSPQQATPGIYQQKIKPIGHSRFEANPQVFSPNLDGHNDYIEFTLKEVPSACWASLHIINANANLIYQSEPQLIDQSIGSFRWTGITQEGKLALPGLYIGVLKTQNKHGEREIFRCSFGVAAQHR